jgi:hypothetical protein
VEGYVYDTSPINIGFTVDSVPLAAPVQLSGLGPPVAAHLTVTGLAISSTGPLQSGSQVTVTWNDANSGNEATAVSWTDTIVVRNDSNQVIANLSVPYDQTVSGPLAAGASSARQATLKLPDGLSGTGTITFLVTVDALNAVATEVNNTSSATATATLAPYADLQVTGLTVDPRGSWTPGETVVVHWNTLNAGNLAAQGSWSEEVSVRNLSTGVSLVLATVPYDASGGANGPLAAGASHARQYAFSWPSGLSSTGQFEFAVTTDSQNQIFEANAAGTAESNNTAVADIASAPDLQVQNPAYSSSSSLQSGGSVTVTWNDINTGSVATSASWYDQVFVYNTTTNDVLAAPSIFYDSNVNGPILPGQGKARSLTFTLPDGPRSVGSILVRVTADINNNVYEYNAAGTGETNNSADVSFTATLATYPDLQVTSLGVDPASGLTSGGALTVHWSDSNTGTKATPAGWNDHIVIQNTTTGQILTDTTVPYNAAVSGNIAPGGSQPQQFSYQLPDGTSGIGQIQVTVTVDSNNAVFESSTSNNTRSASVSSTAGAYPDLQIGHPNVVSPGGVQSGSTLTFLWDDQNTGSRATSGSWYDYVSIKNLTTGETLDTVVVPYSEGSAGNGPIAVGDFRTRQLAYVLPVGTRGTGQIQFFVTTDYYNQIFEFNAAGPNGSSTAESNNSQTLTVGAALAPAPDLQVSTPVLTPTAGLQSGGSGVLSWTVNNTGTGDAVGAFYSHVVVQNLTTNQTLATGDVLYDPAANGNGNITSGGSRTQQFAFTLPPGSPGAGQLQFTITADYFNQIAEYNTVGPGGTRTAESNNSAPFAATSGLAPYADLAASNVTVPALTVADPATVTIGWTVTNVGRGHHRRQLGRYRNHLAGRRPDPWHRDRAGHPHRRAGGRRELPAEQDDHVPSAVPDAFASVRADERQRCGVREQCRGGQLRRGSDAV